MYRLQKIEICGFRGFAKKCEIQIDDTLTLLYGGNRRGKSSIVNAVEWCLFGSEVAGLKYAGGMRERIDWEVKNLNAPQCHVRCVFRDGGKTLTVLRTYRTSRKTDLVYQEGGAAESTDDKKLHALLAISPADFVSSVHLHPEIVRKLIVAEPRERKEAIDRLLGLSELRDMLNAFAAEKPSTWTDTLEQSKAMLDERLKTALDEKKRIIDSEGAELIGAGFSQADATIEGGQAYAAKITDEVLGFATTYGLPTPALTAPTDFSRLPQFRTQLSAAAQKLRNDHPVLADQGKHFMRKNTLDGLKTGYTAQAKAVGQAGAALAQYPEKRTLDELNAEVAADAKEIERIDVEMKEIKKNAGILDNALAFFQGRTDGDTLACPLCGEATHTVQEWRSHIQQEINAKNFAPLVAAKQEKANTIAGLEKSKDDKLTLERRITDEKQRLAQNVTNIQTFIVRTISSSDDPAAIIDAEIQSEDAALAGLQGQVATINATLGRFQDAVRHLDRFQRIGKAELDISNIESIRENENYKELKTIRGECEQYAEDVELLIEGLKNAVSAEAEQRLAAAQTSISENFKKITDRSDFPGLKVSVAPDGYWIELTDTSGNNRSAVPILNHGDMNCAALSIFLALASNAQISHQLGFVILDDPSQSLDETTKKNLCSVFAKLCDSRQVIMATADTELAHDVLHMTKHKDLPPFDRLDSR